LNKADSLSLSDLVRVEGDLLWNLSPLLGGNRSPPIYAVSLRSRDYVKSNSIPLVSEQENNLAKDIHDIINQRITNKIAQARRHSVSVQYFESVESENVFHYNNYHLISDKSEKSCSTAQHIFERLY
jgi:hypothetical protein